MSSPLDPTFGFWLIALWIQTLVIETFQIVLFFQVTYSYLIDGFGDVNGLQLLSWQDSYQLLGTFLSAFIVQMYFGYCIYVLDGRSKIIPAIIVGSKSLLGGSNSNKVPGRAGISTDWLWIRFAQLDDKKIKLVSSLQPAFTLICDILITASLVSSLAKRKGSVKLTNSILTTLMINAVNRGVLTAVCALLVLVLFLALPGTFYFFIGVELSGKLYMNSALATLNSRQHIVNKAHIVESTINWNSIPMDGVTSNGIGTVNAVAGEGHVCILVNKQTTNDSELPDYKTPAFASRVV
ncbi:hypothetical protein CVT25_011258 [Psilocybe cyanescens]|uniref:DUF6534 domain-containing protein n=1 Tax=Psilocybe cyanescens TaxID=93625 RepID=A0A409X122_PSICY|nr:hypothetical protein CVT25_011258 [Psilocybe cyanescens]